MIQDVEPKRYGFERLQDQRIKEDRKRKKSPKY